MYKKLLTVAVVAGLIFPGLTVADVKIFGKIQAETGTFDSGDDTLTTAGRADGSGAGATLGGGASAFGLSGSEKLDNGMTAYFKFNNHFTTFTSSNTLTARDRFVGLKGEGWHVQFGRMNSRYKAASAKYDPMIATGLQSRFNGGVSGLHNGYIDDVVEIGFKTSGFSGGFQIKWEDSKSDTDVGDLGRGKSDVDAGSWSVNLKYGGKGWEVGVAHIDADIERGTDPNGSADGTKFHGKFKTGSLTLMGQYETIDADNAGAGNQWDGARFGGAQGHGIKNHTDIDGSGSYESWHFTAVYKLSKATALIGRYALTETEYDSDNTDGESNHFALALSHGFSKRTKVYGGYMMNDYERDDTDDQDLDGWIAGLLHSF